MEGGRRGGAPVAAWMLFVGASLLATCLAFRNSVIVQGRSRSALRFCFRASLRATRVCGRQQAGSYGKSVEPLREGRGQTLQGLLPFLVDRCRPAKPWFRGRGFALSGPCVRDGLRRRVRHRPVGRV